MQVHRLSRTDARRVAVQAQLLSAERPTDLLDTVRRLTLLQADFTKHVALNADLVLWSRLGPGYERRHLVDAVERRDLVELRGFLRPAEDLALYRAAMARRPKPGELEGWRDGVRRWVEANDQCRRDILVHLDESGPSTAREIPDTCVKPWESTGWTNNKNVMRMLEFMEQRGEVAVSDRLGRERMWDLAERVYPATPVVPEPEASRVRDERRLQSLGIARATGPECPIEPNDVGEAGEPAVIDGAKGEWRVDPAALDRIGRFEGRTALISPLDRLVFDRARMEEIFEFDYQLEMYKPAPKRRWGYFALPILHGDRLVGKLDAESKPKAHVLRVNAIHEDVPFTKAMRAAVHAELDDLARMLGLDVLLP